MSYTEYIPRDTVDNVLLELEDRLKNNPFAFTAMAMAIDKIDNIPAADVASVVHGRWTNYYFHPCGNRGKCSVCGKDNKPTNYCPYCGAKMDESEE